MIGRLLSNENLFHNIYTATKDESKIAFVFCIQGAIKSIEIKEGQSLICQKSLFLLAVGDVELSVFFYKKIGAGIFSGEGLFNTVITGSGKVIVQTMSIAKPARSINPYISHPEASSSNSSSSILNTIIKNK